MAQSDSGGASSTSTHAIPGEVGALVSTIEAAWLAQLVLGAGVIGVLISMPFLVRTRASSLAKLGVPTKYTRRLVLSWYLSTAGFILVLLSLVQRGN